MNDLANLDFSFGAVISQQLAEFLRYFLKLIIENERDRRRR